MLINGNIETCQVDQKRPKGMCDFFNGTDFYADYTS